MLQTVVDTVVQTVTGGKGPTYNTLRDHDQQEIESLVIGETGEEHRRWAMTAAIRHVVQYSTKVVQTEGFDDFSRDLYLSLAKTTEAAMDGSESYIQVGCALYETMAAATGGTGVDHLTIIKRPRTRKDAWLIDLSGLFELLFLACLVMYDQCGESMYSLVRIYGQHLKMLVDNKNSFGLFPDPDARPSAPLQWVVLVPLDSPLYQRAERELDVAIDTTAEEVFQALSVVPLPSNGFVSFLAAASGDTALMACVASRPHWQIMPLWAAAL